MELNTAFLIITILFFIVLCAPRIQEFENFWNSNYYGGYQSGRAWVGFLPYWAPAIIPYRFLPPINKK